MIRLFDGDVFRGADAELEESRLVGWILPYHIVFILSLVLCMAPVSPGVRTTS
jgi:hypothetical protein